MRITLLLLLITFCCTAQDKPHKVTPTQNEQYCVYVGKHDAAKRRSFYPFNKAVKVELIAFIDRYSQNGNIGDKSDSASSLKKDMYIKLADNSYELNKRRLIDTVLLTTASIDELTDILYNYKYPPVSKAKDGTILIDEPVGCYNPRNAIIFKDSKNRIIEYIEICFECEKYVFSSSKIKKLSYCGKTYSMLQEFFENKGIKYGTLPEHKN